MCMGQYTHMGQNNATEGLLVCHTNARQPHDDSCRAEQMPASVEVTVPVTLLTGDSELTISPYLILLS